MFAEIGVIDAAVIRFVFFEFSCVCEKGAAVVVVTSFHRYFRVPVFVCTGFGVFPVNSESC